jgi:ABC-2 type transport system ATP-binding protein
MRIELTNVHKRFAEQHVLCGIALSIAEGERVALVGPNGSGKSTLLRALMGMLRVEGEVRLDGMDPFQQRREVARRLAYVPQLPPRLNATVQEIVRTVCTLRGSDAAAIELCARKLELDLPALYDTPFSNLSGGMKQKLLIALAFTSGASLYILDEPTASLDVRTRARFGELLEEATRGATLILCSHRAAEVARLADRVIELSEGLVVRDLFNPRRAA